MSETDTERDARHRTLIEERLRSDGLNVVAWTKDEMDQLHAILGTWEATEDDPGQMHSEGDEGTLSIYVVGSPEHGNEKVEYGFTPEGSDVPSAVTPFENVEPVG